MTNTNETATPTPTPMQVALATSLKTSYQLLHNAEKILDRVRGDGYAAEHPELVAQLMLVAAIDFHAGNLTAAMTDIKAAVTDLTGDI